MVKYSLTKLIDNGYTVENAKITKVDLSMADYGCLTLSMTLEGAGWCVVYGGYCLGNGYLGAKESDFRGSAAGTEYLMRIMDVVGVEKFQDLKGQYIRVASQGWGSTIKIIGNLISDQWFDAETFFIDKKESEL